MALEGRTLRVVAATLLGRRSRDDPNAADELIVGVGDTLRVGSGVSLSDGDGDPLRVGFGVSFIVSFGD
jgi:hypothetical protein